MPPDPDRLYADAVRKGWYLATQLRDDARRNRTQYNLDDSLQRHGWQLMQSDERPPDSNDMARRNFYNALRLSTSAPDNVRFMWQHIEMTDPRPSDGAMYQATYALYTFIVNPQAIIALNSIGPESAASESASRIRDDGIIPLKHWSDVVFLQWKQFCERRRHPINGLRYIIQDNISNADTSDIVLEAARRAQKPIRGWGQQTARFRQGSEGFCAILASPNGIGPAYFLAQHQTELGRLQIDVVTAFYTWPYAGLPGNLNLCFYVNPY